MEADERAILQRLMQRAFDIVREEGQFVLDEQGHRASGKLRNSFQPRLHIRVLETVQEILIEDYGLDVDRRRPASEFPTFGAALQELYDDLLEWSSYVKPNLPRVEREQFTRAVIRKFWKEGSPTSGSKKFSKTGKRTGWIDETIERSEEKIAMAIEDSGFVEFVIGRAMQQGAGNQP